MTTNYNKNRFLHNKDGDAAAKWEMAGLTRRRVGMAGLTKRRVGMAGDRERDKDGRCGEATTAGRLRV